MKNIRGQTLEGLQCLNRMSLCSDINSSWKLPKTSVEIFLSPIKAVEGIRDLGCNLKFASRPTCSRLLEEGHVAYGFESRATQMCATSVKPWKRSILTF